MPHARSEKEAARGATARQVEKAPNPPAEQPLPADIRSSVSSCLQARRNPVPSFHYSSAAAPILLQRPSSAYVRRQSFLARPGAPSSLRQSQPRLPARSRRCLQESSVCPDACPAPARMYAEGGEKAHQQSSKAGSAGSRYVCRQHMTAGTAGARPRSSSACASNAAAAYRAFCMIKKAWHTPCRRMREGAALWGAAVALTAPGLPPARRQPEAAKAEFPRCSRCDASRRSQRDARHASLREHVRHARTRA